MGVKTTMSTVNAVIDTLSMLYCFVFLVYGIIKCQRTHIRIQCIFSIMTLFYGISFLIGLLSDIQRNVSILYSDVCHFTAIILFFSSMTVSNSQYFAQYSYALLLFLMFCSVIGYIAFSHSIISILYFMAISCLVSTYNIIILFVITFYSKPNNSNNDELNKQNNDEEKNKKNVEQIGNFRQHMNEKENKKDYETMAWTKCDASTFRVRDIGYFGKEKCKKQSEAAMYSVFAVDAFSVNQKIKIEQIIKSKQSPFHFDEFEEINRERRNR